MTVMIFPRRKKIRELDKRVADARAEARLSRQRLETVRQEIVAPRNEVVSNNGFADIIRRGLSPHLPSNRS
jgi:hypothetical protein